MSIFMFSQYGSYLITNSIMVFVALGFIINEVGWAGLIGTYLLVKILLGVVLIFLGTFLNSWISKLM